MGHARAGSSPAFGTSTFQAYRINGRLLFLLEKQPKLTESVCYTNLLHKVTDGGGQNEVPFPFSFVPGPESLFLLFQDDSPSGSAPPCQTD